MSPFTYINTNKYVNHVIVVKTHRKVGILYNTLTDRGLYRVFIPNALL